MGWTLKGTSAPATFVACATSPNDAGDANDATDLADWVSSCRHKPSRSVNLHLFAVRHDCTHDCKSCEPTACYIEQIDVDFQEITIALSALCSPPLSRLPSAAPLGCMACTLQSHQPYGSHCQARTRTRGHTASGGRQEPSSWPPAGLLICRQVRISTARAATSVNYAVKCQQHP